MAHAAIKERTKLERQAGRAAVALHRQEAKIIKQRTPKPGPMIIKQQVAGVDRKVTRADVPENYSARDPQEHNLRMSAIDPNVPLPDAIATCIERADRAFQMVYHPGPVRRARRWLARKLWV